MNTDEAKRLGDELKELCEINCRVQFREFAGVVDRLVAMVQGVEKERVLLADAGRVIRNLVMPDHPVLRAIETALAVGDAQNPQLQAAEELIALGYWRDIPEARSFASKQPAEQAPDVSAAGEPAGIACHFAGADGFTVAVFRTKDVPVGAKIYAVAPRVEAAGEPVAWANNDVPPMLFWGKTEALKHTDSEADLVPLFTKDQT